MEIITSQYPADEPQNESNTIEDSGCDYVSKDCSDSEDMCRVFAVSKKKKKHKKKKKKNKSSNLDESDFLVDSDDDFQHVKKRKARNDLNLNEATLNQRAVMKAIEEGNNVSKEAAKKCSNLSSKTISNVPESSNDENSIVEKNSTDPLELYFSNNLQSQSIENNAYDSHPQSIENNAYDSHPQSIGNDTYGSHPSGSNQLCQETVNDTPLNKDLFVEEQPSRAKSGIKLPKARKKTYKIGDPSIKSTFPSCYVVLKQLEELPVSCLKENWIVMETPLELSTRLKFLKSLCAMEKIKCRKKKKKKHFFDVTNCSGQSEEEFLQSHGGKSLRRRNKNISYKEPSEFSLPFAEEMDEESLIHKKSKKSKQDKELLTMTNPVVEEKESDLDIRKKKSKTGKYRGSEESQKNSAKNVVEKKSADGTTIQEVVCYPKSTIQSNLPFSNSVPFLTSRPLDSNISTLSNSSNLIPIPSSVLPSMNFPGGGLNVQNVRIPFSTSVTASPLVNLPQVPLSLATQGSKPQYCMMKMDGKDVLVQLMPSAAAPQPVLLPGGKRVMMNPPTQVSQPRSIAPAFIRNGSGNRLLPTNSAQSHARFVSSTQLPAGLFMNPSVVGGNTVPLIGSPPIASVTTTSVRVPALGGPQSSVATLGHVGAISTSSGSNVRAVPTPVLTPSTSVRTSTPASNSLPGTGNVRNLRVFVPGCSATGTPGHFTTLTTVNSGGSPLTRLSASSQLLPQKRAADTVLSADEKAAKRRKLEKKYPLPPGVVIKTESLDVPPPNNPAKTSSGMRSLLQQNIQVFSAPRGPGGSNIQSIRLVSPALATALSNRSGQPVRPVMFRTSNVRGSTLLVPFTVNSSGSSVVTISTASPLISSNLVTGSAGSSAITMSTVVSTTSVSSTSTTASSSLPPPRLHQEGNSRENGINSSSPISTCTSVSSNSIGSREQLLEASQAALDSLKKIVKSQLSLGLKGERLDKLKTLLQQKEAAVQALLTSPPVPSNHSSESVEPGEVNGHVGSEVDPFVID